MIEVRLVVGISTSSADSCSHHRNAGATTKLSTSCRPGSSVRMCCGPGCFGEPPIRRFGSGRMPGPKLIPASDWRALGEHAATSMVMLMAQLVNAVSRDRRDQRCLT